MHDILIRRLRGPAVLAAAVFLVSTVPLPHSTWATESESRPGAQGRGNSRRCTVSVTGVAFGRYNATSPTPTDSQGFVNYRCTGNHGHHQSRNIRVQIGAGTSGRISQRTMRGPGGTARYNLFLDARRQVIWGDGAHGSRTLTTSNTPNNRTVSVPIYARVPARQSLAQGRYADTLAVTVVF